MNKLISILLLFSLLLSSFWQSVTLFHYLVNQKYYTEVLCENKAKPKMNCHGKCHLMKEMKEQGKSEQSPNAPTKEKHETLEFFQKETEFVFNSFYELESYISFYLLVKIKSFVFSIFHPPTYY
jgi:hypothetical protein